VSNAVKYTVRGSAVTLSRADSHARLECRHRYRHSTRGPAVLFNEFYRRQRQGAANPGPDSAGHRQAAGLRYGGEIGVASEEGTGTTMTVNLPLAPGLRDLIPFWSRI